MQPRPAIGENFVVNACFRYETVQLSEAAPPSQCGNVESAQWEAYSQRLNQTLSFQELPIIELGRRHYFSRLTQQREPLRTDFRRILVNYS